MDRTPKFPLEQIAVATRGPRGPEEQAIEAELRGEAVERPGKRERAKPARRQRGR
jgi:hypothetical protein